jgi:type IV secretion system protein VirB2
MCEMRTRGLKKWASVFFLAVVFMLLGSGMACATGTGAGLPWESAIKTIADSLSGPVAFSICVLGMFAGGVAIAFGADLPGWVRTVATITLVAALIGMSGDFLRILGLNAATVL